MESVQLIVSVISVLTTGFALVLSFFIFFKFKNIVYLSYIVFYTVLFVFITALGLFTLLSLLPPSSDVNRWRRAMDAAGPIVKSLLIFCLPFLFHFLYEVPHRLQRNLVWGGACLAMAAGAVYRAALRPEGAAADVFAFLEPAALTALYGYLLVLFIRYRIKMRTEEIRPLHRTYIILLTIYFLLYGVQFALVETGVLTAAPATDGLLVPALVIVWNVCFLRFIMKFLQVTPIAVPGIDISGFGALQRNDITEREREIIRELLTGATVSAIASKLFISVHTAKTHVKNIYQKLEVRNRVELYHLVSAQPAPARSIPPAPPDGPSLS